MMKGICSKNDIKPLLKTVGDRGGRSDDFGYDHVKNICNLDEMLT